MLPASPRRVPVMIAAAAALVAGSLALSAPAFADTPSAPTLTAPAAGANVAAFSPITFSWSGSTGSVYVFEDSSSAAIGAGGAFAVADGGQQVTTETSTVLPPTGVAQTRYWHVGVQADGGVVWSGARQVVFGTQAPDAGVGTPVTVTAPPAAPAPSAPAAASAPAASAPAPAAASTPAAAASGAATAPAATTPAATTPAASSPAPAPTTASTVPATSSVRAERTAATSSNDPAAIPLALSGSLGAALLLLAVLRLIRLRRRPADAAAVDAED